MLSRAGERRLNWKSRIGSSSIISNKGQLQFGDHHLDHDDDDDDHDIDEERTDDDSQKGTSYLSAH